MQQLFIKAIVLKLKDCLTLFFLSFDLILQSVDGSRKSRSGNAQKNVYSSGQSFDGGTVDAEGRFIS